MTSPANDNPDQYVTTLGTTGAELFQVFSPFPHRDGFTFDGKPYTEELAQQKYLYFTGGYGDFFPTPNVVPGRLVWVGTSFEHESGGSTLEYGDDLDWYDFKSQPQDAGS